MDEHGILVFGWALAVGTASANLYLWIRSFKVFMDSPLLDHFPSSQAAKYPIDGRYLAPFKAALTAYFVMYLSAGIFVFALVLWGSSK